MTFIEADAAEVFAGMPVPTACMLQTVMRAVMSAVAAISEMSRILHSSGAGCGLISNFDAAVLRETGHGAVLCGTREPAAAAPEGRPPAFSCDHAICVCTRIALGV